MVVRPLGGKRREWRKKRRGKRRRKEKKEGGVKSGGTHTILASAKGKGVLKIKKKAITPTEAQNLAKAQCQLLKEVKVGFDAKYEELYTILRLKYVPVECTKGGTRIEFNSLIRKMKYKAVEFLIANFERIDIDDGKKVGITDYLKFLQGSNPLSRLPPQSIATTKLSIY